MGKVKSGERLHIYDFGQRMIDTQDLDPVYSLLWHTHMDRDLFKHWLLAYLSFYHAGTASWVCNSKGQADYWGRMHTAAGSKDYPRSSERRHFRGKFATEVVARLSKVGVPGLLQFLDTQKTLQARDVISQVKTWYGFGDWVAFKMADIVERVGHTSVQFDKATAMYESPRKGADLVWDLYHEPQESTAAQRLDWSIGYLQKKFDQQLAPPRYDRKIGFPEYETLFCKFAAYHSGHYEIGEDVASVRKSLLKFAKVKLCQELIKAGKVGDLW